ncbi:dipeptidase [Pararhodonellum marinum]|uniref:dipeptidase n=1 Tax=Pararhodonellum marinum TaxID=2755358 RepID=UPI00188EC586|nr:dipeptidase [Pararhodonellum marinum]
MKKLLIVLLSLFFFYWLTTFFVPSVVEKGKNPIKTPPPYTVSDKAMQMYESLDFIADLHCDALLWGRDLTKKSNRGHVDFPRMQEAKVAFQVFTIVSKSPVGQNIEHNETETLDNITLLNIAQGRPISNWFSLMKRTEYQANKLHKFAINYSDEFMIVKSKADFEQLLAIRQLNPQVIGGMLGVEGAQALKGDLKNLDILFDAGIRLIGPTHFFDNELGGSAHGVSMDGLTPFGREVIRKMNEKNMIIDLAHISPKMMDDILDLSEKPVLVSHTGLRAVVNNQRNLSDEQIKRIAGNGGLIGIAFFETTVGEDALAGIVKSMAHIRDLVGIEHAALGSDFDGSVEVPFDITGFPLIVEALMKEGFTESEIRAVMGENIRAFMLDNL